MADIIIPANAYGEPTSRIQDLVLSASSISWFEGRRERDIRGSAKEILDEHLDALRYHAHTGLPARLEINWMVGGFDLLHKNQWGEDPYFPWGNLWQHSNSMLLAILKKVEDKITQSDTLADRVGPPLWPVRGQPNICGTAFATAVGAAVLQFVYLRTKTLLAPIMIHFLFNGSWLTFEKIRLRHTDVYSEFGELLLGYPQFLGTVGLLIILLALLFFRKRPAITVLD
jgi:hypothetical protein